MKVVESVSCVKFVSFDVHRDLDYILIVGNSQGPSRLTRIIRELLQENADRKEIGQRKRISAKDIKKLNQM